MRFFLSFILIIFSGTLFAEIKICSWNLKDFGSSKNREEIEFIASVVNEFDVVILQEVVASFEGPQSVSELADCLNRMGNKWDYTTSDPTISSSYKTERYAYLWKTSRLIKIGDTWLEKNYANEIDREPYYITFKQNEKVFSLVNFHAITKSKQPETEIKYFKLLPSQYPNLNLIFCGDFNCPESHTVFNPLKSMGYKPVLIGQKTSLRQECINNDCLASEFDNIFFRTDLVDFISSGVIHFYKKFNTLEQARLISDHIPIYFVFSLK